MKDVNRSDLPKLYSRSEFFSKSRELIDSHEPGYYILSCSNIENFKYINDRYGTKVGDTVLEHIALAIMLSIKITGGICAHIAGDDFAMLFPAKYSDSDELVSAYANASSPDCIVEKLRLRVGRFLVAMPSAPVESMYDHAKIAANSIKGNYDVNIAYYNDLMKDELVRKQQVIYEMESALSSGQFEPWLQPQYNHATGAMIGAEVLVRWNRNGTYISPAEFVPIFEQNGFIYRMDCYIWEEACRLLRKWIDAGMNPPPLSVNVSRRDILHDDFIKTLTGIIEKYSISPELVRFEVTESAFAKGSGNIISKISALIDMGYIVEIDDFGSGYSSLNTLKDVPSSVLKLDMRFLSSTKNSRRAGNIIESIVRMAKWLGMAVIAEGVESKEQADYLKSIGCYYIQGYFYAKPMPCEEYEKLFTKSDKELKLSRLRALKTFDNNEFWNPKSMDTLIFNSYVGGACIFEYCNRKTEIIRLNDQYIQQFGGIIPPGTELYGAAVSKYMDEDAKKEFFAVIEKAIATHREASCEVKISNGKQTEYIRSTVRAIASTEDRILCYGVIVNITEQRVAEINARNMATQLDTIMSSIHASVTATLYENQNKMDVFYINRGFYKMFGYTKEQFESEVADMNDLIVSEDKGWVLSKVDAIVKSEVGETYEFRARRRDGEIIWVQMTNSIVSLEGFGDHVLLGVATEITESKEYSTQLQFLNESAHEILAQPDPEKAINLTLRKILKYFSGERSYIIEADYTNGVVNNTFEICASNVTSEIDRLKNVPIELTSGWFDLFKNNKFVEIYSVSALDNSQSELKSLLLSQKINSIIAAPLWVDGALIGFVGVDNPSLPSIRRLPRLAALGDYLAILLTRRNLTSLINSEQKRFFETVNDIPGGFARLKRKADGSFVPVYASDSLKKLFGMDDAKISEVYGENVLNGVHPDDIEAARDAHKKMLGDGSTVSYRVMHASGKYIRIIMSGKAVTEPNGELYLNLYYTGATEQMAEHEKIVEILDNLPCGAALYEYDGSDFRLLHLNKYYTEMIGRTEDPSVSPLEYIYSGDRQNVLNEIQSAVSENRDASCDMRILSENGSYKYFHTVARIKKQEDGKYLLYVTYLPITEYQY